MNILKINCLLIFQINNYNNIMYFNMITSLNNVKNCNYNRCLLKDNILC